MRHWILQANPRRYRFSDAIRDGYEISSWSVAWHRNDIIPGDHFALWVSGEERGVYALGVVTEPAEYRLDNDPYWMEQADASAPDWHVGIHIRETFLDSPILGEELAKDTRFANALILRMPGGRNPFPLTEEEWRAVLSRRPVRQTADGFPAARRHLVLIAPCYGNPASRARFADTLAREAAFNEPPLRNCLTDEETALLLRLHPQG